MKNSKKELFRCDLLDTKYKIIRGEIVFIGSLTASIVCPQDTFKARNPGVVGSGHLHLQSSERRYQAGREDILLTRRIAQAADVLGIEVLNHIIIADGCHFSFRANGLIQRTSQTGACVTA
jgi:DNA repair protein RadC